jgi:hypothetical protein
MSSQANLFEIEPRVLPPGMRYWEEVVSEAQEHSLVRFIEQLPLKPFEFAGGFKGNRRIVSFGWRYDYNHQTLVETSAIPKELGRELIKGGWSRCSSGNGPFAGDQISAQNELVRSRPS